MALPVPFVLTTSALALEALLLIAKLPALPPSVLVAEIADPLPLVVAIRAFADELELFTVKLAAAPVPVVTRLHAGAVEADPI
jgi:hypothetical protein